MGPSAARRSAPSPARPEAAGTGWWPLRPLPSSPLSEGPGQRPRTPGAGGGAGSPGSAARSPAQRGWEPGAALGQVGAAGRVSWWGCAAAADGSCVVLGGPGRVRLAPRWREGAGEALPGGVAS